jgi:hypothetical protein
MIFQGRSHPGFFDPQATDGLAFQDNDPSSGVSCAVRGQMIWLPVQNESGRLTIQAFPLTNTRSLPPDVAFQQA